MIKAFLASLAAALLALLLALVVTAGIAESMSARQAGNAWLAFIATEVLTLALSVGGYRRLAAHWGGAPAPTWSWLLFGLLVGAASALIGLLGLLLLNR